MHPDIHLDVTLSGSLAGGKESDTSGPNPVTNTPDTPEHPGDDILAARVMAVM